MKNLVLLASVLALETITLENGMCALTESQLDAIEARLKELTDAQAAASEQHQAAIKEKDEQIAQLQNLLKQKPGADGSQVIDNAADNANSFLASVKAAQELFDQLP